MGLSFAKNRWGAKGIFRQGGGLKNGEEAGKILECWPNEFPIEAKCRG